MHALFNFWILIPCCLLVGIFPRFSQSTFEKRQVAANHISKDPCKFDKFTISTNRRRELHSAVFNFSKLNRFWCWALGTYKLKITLKIMFKKINNEIPGEPSFNLDLSNHLTSSPFWCHFHVPFIRLDTNELSLDNDVECRRFANFLLRYTQKCTSDSWIFLFFTPLSILL